jgi:hypothetical protein
LPVMARPKSARRKRGQTEATDRNMAESLVRKLQRHMHTEQWRQVDLFWRMDDGTGEVTAPQMHAALRPLPMAPSRLQNFSATCAMPSAIMETPTARSALTAVQAAAVAAAAA